ncbi:MAG: FtsQ-type POTRA domain-containing protein [Acidobacteria bacterium]|nr:FtsQ-type POTRA domain-containing protein [Acidobacteriota bacterium]
MRELPPIEAKVLPFRRPSAAVKVRRRSPWVALGRPFLHALLLVGVPIALGAWLLTSPTFALDTLEIAGAHRVEASWVESALEPLKGENLIRLPLDAVESAVAGNPWIERVTVDKRLPDRLRIELTEREPAALLRETAQLSYLDRSGRRIAPFDPDYDVGGLLLVSVAGAPGEPVAGAFGIESELAAAAPDWAATLSEVEVLGEGDYRLHLGALEFPLLVRQGTLASRLATLRPMLPELERRYGRLAFVDLRFERRILLQPDRVRT